MRIFCIGRNYAAHATELQNDIPSTPVVFMKPASSLVPNSQDIPFPSHGHELHHEAEIVVEIGKAGKHLGEHQARDHICALGLGLDLTLRDVQSRLKEQGLPWELAKAFDHSAPLGPLTPFDAAVHNLNERRFTCRVNGELRQEGCTADLLFPIAHLVAYLSSIWELLPGDLIYTGTPAGVAALQPGDEIVLDGPDFATAHWRVTD